MRAVHRAQRPDSRDAHRPHRLFVFARPLTQFLLELGELNEQQRAQVPNRARQPRIGIFNRVCQPIHMRRLLRRDDTELRKVRRSAEIGRNPPRCEHPPAA